MSCDSLGSIVALILLAGKGFNVVTGFFGNYEQCSVAPCMCLTWHLLVL